MESNILIPRFHQELIVHKTLNKIEDDYKKILWGWKCRAGKTYGVGHMITSYYQKFERINALIITPAPSETLPQFTNEMFLKFNNFKRMNIFEIKKTQDLNKIFLKQESNYIDSNIIIISKQLLDRYIKNNYTQLNNIHFDLIFFDENHYGGTTNKSNLILEKLSTEKTAIIFLTATYQKTIFQYNIEKECQFFWDIEDEKFCKNYDLKSLIVKHGEEVSYFLNDENIHEKLGNYQKMPELHLISTLLDQDKYIEIKNKIMNNDDNDDNINNMQGFSMDVLFSLKKQEDATFNFEFQNQVKQILQYIIGKESTCIYERIKKISSRNQSRTLLNNENITTQLWFLPFGIGLKINDLSNTLKKFMNHIEEFKDYEIMIINSKVKEIKNLKLNIENVEKEAKKSGKKGVILLAGNQCSLGITLPLVDVVFLMNNISSCDKIMQMMYRCMSESNDGTKKIGFVVDFNISRILHTFIEYPIGNQLLLTNKQKLEYIIQNSLIHLDEDIFESKENKGKLINKLLTIWKNDPINEKQYLIKKINNIHLEH